MRLHISLVKNDHTKRWIEVIQDESNYLISSSAYWLSRDVIFVNDTLTKASNIQEVDWSNGRCHIAGNDELRIYVVYVKDSSPLLVGVLPAREVIAFELSLSPDEISRNKAVQNGFDVKSYDNSEYLDADIISKTYHEGRKQHTEPYVSYVKTINEKYTLSIFPEYSQGAEI